MRALQCLLAIEEDALGGCMGDDAQIGPIADGFQEGAGGTEAHAVLLVDLEIAGALIVAGIEILACRNTEFGGGFSHRIEDRPAQTLALDAQRPATAMACIVVEIVILRAAKQRQHVVPAPAGIAHLAPAVVVARLSAHVDHAIDGGTAAENLAARVEQRAAVEARLFCRAIAPVGARIADAVEIADRDMHPMVIVAAARLQQQHPVFRIHAQPVGEHAAGRTGTDHDVIPFSLVGPLVGPLVGSVEATRHAICSHAEFLVENRSSRKPKRNGIRPLAHNGHRLPVPSFVSGEQLPYYFTFGW
jgi:hypothetical protein